MGGCTSSQDIIIPIPQSRVSPQIINLTNQLFSKFHMCKQIDELVGQIAFTSDQAISLSQVIISCILNYEYEQRVQERDVMKQILLDRYIKQIKDEKIGYNRIEQLIQQKLNRRLTYTNRSRIYHNIANIRKYKQINVRLNSNAYGVGVYKSNRYKQLSDQQLQQIVQYESMAYYSLDVGQKLHFIYKSIQYQYENIMLLLSQYLCRQQNINIISNLSYDLSLEQIIKISKLSKNACEYIQNGIYILLIYLIKSTISLSSNGSASSAIDNQLISIINHISAQYPPGSGLKSQQIYLSNALKQLENPNNYNKATYQFEEQNLSIDNKQSQVDQIIIKYAKIASKNKSLFQQLIKSTCLQRCIYYKIGVKYNPNNPNKKALTRIKQKLFFNKNETNRKDLSGDISTILQRQQKQYINMIDNLLSKISKFKFKITDMVRAKCIFLNIEDIIQTVNQIKRYVKNHHEYALIQIESRFTNKIPISDVTLKILLNQQIIAELQLTVQNNAATYNFAHKVYQLQRTKVFSKIKIINNYYQQYNKQFTELFSKIIQTSSSSSKFSNPAITNIIQKYFNLSSKSIPSFKSIFQSTLQSRSHQLPTLCRSINPKLQDLIIPIVRMQMGRWNKQIGLVINQILKKQHSIKLKSTLLAFFFNKIDLSIQSQRFQQFAFTDEQRKRKNKYMQQYLLLYFGIENAFDYVLQSHRIYHRGQQLYEIQLTKKTQYDNIVLNSTVFVESLVMQYQTEQMIKRLRQYIRFYFITKTYDNKYYWQFQCAWVWLSTIIKNSKNVDKNNEILNELNYLRVIQLIQKSNYKQSQKILYEIRKSYKQKQQYQKVIQSNLLLVQCNINNNKNKNINQIIKEYNDIKQSAKTLGISIKGPQIANTLWRITQYLCNQYTSPEHTQSILATIAKDAFLQLSKTKGNQLIIAMKKLWIQYNKYKIQEPIIESNKAINYIKFHGLQNSGCQHLIRPKWPQLIQLNLFSSLIMPADCQYLLKSNWPKLKILRLSYNQIGEIGCKYISKVDWKQLEVLDLGYNKIGDKGCQHIAAANWKYLKQLSLNFNDIKSDGISHLIKGNWKELSLLRLYCNSIDSKCCQYMSQSDWHKLSRIDLSANSINSQGCEYLSRTSWNMLCNIAANRIQSKGIQYLSKADWPKLKYFASYGNKYKQGQSLKFKMLFKQSTCQFKF